MGTDRSLFDVLAATPSAAEPLGLARLGELTDPANYTAAAGEMVDRLLARPRSG